jgi:5-methylcytosine-specific restriction protein B
MALNLTRLLYEAWSEAPEGSVVLRIHLFGIKYAEDLRGMSLALLVDEAKVPGPYATEIRKAMRLSEYVTLK